MKRFALVLFVVAGSLSAEPQGFELNAGAGAGYMALSQGLETNVGGVLNDAKLGMQFAGGQAFADISRYLTVSVGVWYGLLDATTTIDAASTTETTSANSLLLLDIATVLKYPIAVGDSFTFAPKAGFDLTSYMAGNLGGAAPNTAVRQAVSPFSFIVGADADYTFPNGVFLRLPIELTYALNSKPSSYSGSYIASNTVTFRSGIAVGYRLLGFEPTASPAAPAQKPSPETEAGTEPAQKPSPGIRLAAGGGLSYLSSIAYQSMKNSGTTFDFLQMAGNFGVNGFFDVSEYFTAILGVQLGVGDAAATITSQPSSTPANRLIRLELGAEAKYPMALSEQFFIAPKLGISDLIYLTGNVGDTDLTDGAKQWYSPLLLVAGADLSFALNERWFIRVPLEIGYALNTRLADDFYGSSTYQGSYTITFKTGASVGYRF